MWARAERTALHTSGLSVLETVFVMGVLIMLAGILLPLMTRTYGSAVTERAASTVIDTLREARSRSRGNFQGTAHGVYIDIAVDPPTLTLYQGTSYGARNISRDHIVPLAVGTVVTASPSNYDVPFSGSSGGATARTLTVTSGEETTTLMITSGGFAYELP